MISIFSHVSNAPQAHDVDIVDVDQIFAPSSEAHRPIHSPISMGEWQRKEMPGPPDYEAWSEIFRCVRTTFLLLETLTAERMDAYAEHIRQLSARFGRMCWDLVYTADVHMRSEQFERIRRKLHANPEHGYTDACPWNAVLAQVRLMFQKK